MNLENQSYKYGRILFYVSVGLFVLSLTQKCYCTTSSCGDSVMALLVGGIGIMFGGAALTWLANPLLFISWKLYDKNPKFSFLAGISACIIGCSFLLFKQIIGDEAGNYYQIIEYKPGYVLWVASSFTIAVGSLLNYLTAKKRIAEL